MEKIFIGIIFMRLICSGIFASGKKENPFLYVKAQTPEICLVAVRQDGMNLKFVNEQTPEICLAAVQQNGDVIVFVKEQTPEICLTAIRQNGEI